MNKFTWVVLGIVVLVAFLALWLGFSVEEPIWDREQWEKCSDWADEVGLDPNDEKVDFIRDCMEVNKR